MEPSKPTDDRWKELADLLGLPGDQASSEAPQAAPTPAPVEAPRRHDEEPADVAVEMIRQDEPVGELTEIEEIIEESEDAVGEEESELPASATEEEFGEADEDEGAETAGELSAEEGEAPPVPGEEDKPKRGRRRRRRGRRRGGEKGEGEGEGDRPPGQAVEPREPRQGQQPRPREDRPARHAQPAASRDRDANTHERGDSRSRRNNRRDEAPEPRHADTAEDDRSEELEEVEMSHAPAHARNLDDDTDFSDWTVPSWQELISSLYRPDR